MRQVSKLVQTIVISAATLFFSGCASSMNPDVTESALFSNILVIANAHNYEARSQFERSLAQRLRKRGASAKAYHSIASGNVTVDRATVERLINEHAFDAILIARVADRSAIIEDAQSQREVVANTKPSGPLRLFRYDYTEIDQPTILSLDIDISLRTDLYSVASEELYWSTENTLSDQSSIAELIDNATSEIIQGMAQEGLIAN